MPSSGTTATQLHHYGCRLAEPWVTRVSCQHCPCVHRFLESIHHMVPRDGTVLLGGAAGGIHILDIDTGALLVSPRMEDHDGPVTSISTIPILHHFLSSGMDGIIKVNDQMPMLCASMSYTRHQLCQHLTSTVSKGECHACCW